LALSLLSLAFSRLICSVSFLIRSLSLLTRKISFSIRSLSLLTRKISFSISALSFLTRKISFSICLVRSSLCLIRSSISRTGRQLSIESNERHRGSDAGDSPLLGDGDGVTEEGEVVIGGEEGNQTQHRTAQRLCDAETIQTRPGTRR
jgi:hypothetical protein